MDQRRDGTYDICATAEIEQEDSVTGLVGVHQECVDVADVGRQAVSDHEPKCSRDALCGSRQCPRRRHGPKTRMVVYGLTRLVLIETIDELADVGAHSREFIRRAVAADDDVAGSLSRAARWPDG